jgi:predicted DNA-binding transcriptional regulator YafY
MAVCKARLFPSRKRTVLCRRDAREGGQDAHPTQGKRTSPLSRPPLERMLRLHQLIKTEKFPNCRTLADELEVSSKTIQRDIDFLRDRMGLPIAYDQTAFGVSERVWHESQEIHALPRGEIELVLQLGGFEEIERWVLSWGEHARVLAPKQLRERIRRTAKRVASF